MKRDLLYCDMRPRLVRADSECVVEIRPRFNAGRFTPGREFKVAHVMTEDTRARPNSPVAWEKPVRVDADGVLRIRTFFEGEQEHVIRGMHVDDGAEGRVPVEARLYSLADDLYARKPWKGDLHLHSIRSDGVEPPAYVAAACRRIGLDFMALTDHHQYAPSLEAIEAFAVVPHDLKIYPGEEAHPNGVHIVNFGGRFGVDELLQREETIREVEAIRRSQPPVPPGVDPAWAAQTRWTFDKVREAGGLGVFCHPYWSFHSHYSLAEAYIDYIFETQPFDAYEVIGGFGLNEPDANPLQVARYHEERARGRVMPVVGASDAHGCERGDLFGWYYTIVFAPSPDLADLIGSIKGGWSVAVEALPGARARAHGSFRLVKYALFLLREVFPLHDELCEEEGRWMHRHLAGDAGAAGKPAMRDFVPAGKPAMRDFVPAEELGRASGRVARLYAALWGT